MTLKNNNYLLFIFFFFLFGFTSSLNADTIKVTSLGNDGAGTLREAIILATDGDSILINIQGRILLDSSLLVRKKLTVIGQGFSKTQLDGQLKTRIFEVLSPGSLNLQDVSVINGDALNLLSTGGAAIQSTTHLHVERCLFQNNTGEFGGAIHVFNSRLDSITVSIQGSTFIQNKSTILDGAAVNFSSAGTSLIQASLVNCLFTENISASTGGAINLFRQQDGHIELKINSCTIVNNQAVFAGGINNFTADTILICNTILAENIGRSSHPNALGNLSSSGYNLLEDTLGFPFSAMQTDIISAEAGLGPLITIDTLMPSIGLLCGSPAIDRGDPNIQAVDIRGFSRDILPDIGAHERNKGSDLRITTKEDSMAGSLRYAIIYSCPGDTLRFADLSGRIPLKDEIVLEKDLLFIGNSDNIGTGFYPINNNRFFIVENGVHIGFENFSFWEGNPSQSGGGAILNKGSLTIKRSSFAYNQAISGGAIANYGDGDTAKLVIENSTFFQNEATTLDGGAIDNYGFDSPAFLSLNHCTFSENSAEKKGGAIYANNDAEAHIKNSILGFNSAQIGNESNGNIISQGNNLWLDTTLTSVSFQSTDIVNADPQFDKFDYYGGSNYSIRLLSNSPAIDTGDGQNAPSIDQRGFSRLFGAAVDMGAYEVDPATSIANSLHDDKAILIFPNPTSDFLHIDFLGNSFNTNPKIELYDLAGKLIVSHSPNTQAVNQPYSLYLGSLTHGVYFLKVKLGDKLFSKQVLIR